MAAAGRPNVLLICVDDLKPVAGCYGGRALTPHIDRLAARGVRFDLAFCNQAVCAPSRNALMTGLRPQSLGIYDLATNFRRARPDAVTLAQAFRNAGYRTAAIGKIFHVGHGNREDPASWTVPHWRSDVVAYVLPESRAGAELTREEALFANASAAGRPRGSAWEAPEVPDDAYPDGRAADEAVRRLRMEAEKDGDDPFFLALGFVKPHLPFCAPEKYWQLYERSSFAPPDFRDPPAGAPAFAPTDWGELRQYKGIPEKGALPDELQRLLIHGYHAATSYMDAQLGKVLDALESTGLAERTIVVFWGDHGWHLGDHGMWCKHTNYEQAARVPLIVAVPGGVSGASTKAIVESVDIYPTLCELAGVPVSQGIDGRSFARVLGEPSAAAREHAIHVYPRGKRIGRAVRTAEFRLVEWKVPGEPESSAVVELYDLARDPHERRNVAADRPDVVADLRAVLAREPEAKPQLRVPLDRREMFHRRDADGDGLLTREEFLARQPDPDQAPARFLEFDRNGDGVLTEEEFVTRGGRENRPAGDR